MILERRIEGQCLPLVSVLRNPTNELLSDISARYVVLFYFSMTDCGSCLQDEIATWNQFIQSQETQICSVIGVTDTTDSILWQEFQKTFDVKFPVLHVPGLRANLADYAITTTPTVLFGDMEQNKIIYCFLANPMAKSNAWFVPNILSYLDECKHQSHTTKK